MDTLQLRNTFVPILIMQKDYAHTMIACDGITHYYGSKLIYQDLSFEVAPGKVLGLLGKNGTGKTTIINILNGFLKPREGTCYLLGKESTKLTNADKARIGLLLEGHIQYSFFNIYQIEHYYAPFFGTQWDREAYFGLLEKLQVHPKQKISTMSCGQRSQVALGLLFAQNPDLLILDDFSMGLDPGYRLLFVDYLREWATAGSKTVFLTSHIIQDMERLIDDCIILDYGKILLHRPTQEILDEYKYFSFPLEQGVRLPEHPELHHPEILLGYCKLLSRLSPAEVIQILHQQGILITQDQLQAQEVTLEETFIGLTGKY